MRLALSDTVDPRMADADHGWWFPERQAGGAEPLRRLRVQRQHPLPRRPGILQPGDRQLASHGALVPGYKELGRRTPWKIRAISQSKVRPNNTDQVHRTVGSLV